MTFKKKKERLNRGVLFMLLIKILKTDSRGKGHFAGHFP